MPEAKEPSEEALLAEALNADAVEMDGNVVTINRAGYTVIIEPVEAVAAVVTISTPGDAPSMIVRLEPAEVEQP